MSVWSIGNNDTLAVMSSGGEWQVNSGRSHRTTWYDNAYALPKWVQKDILLLKWMPKEVWCSLGMWREVVEDIYQGELVAGVHYSLFSPTLRKLLSQLEKENQNEQ